MVKKSGDIKSIAVKRFDRDYLWVKCNFKSVDDFVLQHAWHIPHGNHILRIELIGKSEGKPGHENKYVFPVPVPRLSFFGNGILVAKMRTFRESAAVPAETEEKMVDGGDGEGRGEDAGGSGDDEADMAEEGINLTILLWDQIHSFLVSEQSRENEMANNDDTGADLEDLRNNRNYFLTVLFRSLIPSTFIPRIARGAATDTSVAVPSTEELREEEYVEEV